MSLSACSPQALFMGEQIVEDAIKIEEGLVATPATPVAAK
jgi:hypothetical protein